MDPTMMRRALKPGQKIGYAGLLIVAFFSPSAGAQQEPAVNSGVQYLRKSGAKNPGESAMIALALMKAEVPHNDPAVQSCMSQLRGRFATAGSYSPAMGDGSGTYEAAATIMALATEDAEANRSMIATVATYIAGRQNVNGSWDYVNRSAGDTSISQYAVLGLWEAENLGVDIAPSVWDRAASWYLSVQSSAGSWNYHRDEANQPETCAMTAAGIGSLLICQRQLERYRTTRRDNSSLLTPLLSDAQRDGYKPSTSATQIDGAVKRGISWLSANFAPANPALAGQTPYYMLYGVERIGALADKQSLGRVDWYTKGRDFIRSTQHSDGSWHSAHGIEMNTVWSILFLVKSTAKTIQRITLKKLGAGTLLGGRELPKDLSSLTVAGGRVVSRPMNGAIEGMLAVLEDPRAEVADAAVAGMVDRYYAEGPEALRPFKVRFRKMLSDKDVGVRGVAAWALAHTGDLDVIPQLIDVLVTPNQDEEVIGAARLGLLLLSRKIDGFGPPSPSTADERKAAAHKWREWFEAIRPLDLDDHDEGTQPAPSSAPAAPASSPAPTAPRSPSR
jgi:hypothetical protein